MSSDKSLCNKPEENPVHLFEVNVEKYNLPVELTTSIDLEMNEVKISSVLSILRLRSKRQFYKGIKTEGTSHHIVYSEYIVLKKDKKYHIITNGSYESESWINELTLPKHAPKQYFTLSNKVIVKAKNNDSITDTNSTKNDSQKDTHAVGDLLCYYSKKLNHTFSFYDGECRTIQNRYRRTLDKNIDLREEKFNISTNLLYNLINESGVFKC
jgi:hypothetical protein